MAEGPSAEQVVELVYRPTVKDFNSGLRARSRATPAGRGQRKIFTIGYPVIAFCFLMAFLTGGGDDFPVPALVVMVLLPVVLLGAPWLQARQFQKMTEKQGQFRTVVTAAGVNLTTENASSSVNWTMLPRYVEASDVFVLLSADKQAVGMTVLPKRGLETAAGVDQLRSLLDRYSSRVGT